MSESSPRCPASRTTTFVGLMCAASQAPWASGTSVSTRPYWRYRDGDVADIEAHGFMNASMSSTSRRHQERGSSELDHVALGHPGEPIEVTVFPAITGRAGYAALFQDGP